MIDLKRLNEEGRVVCGLNQARKLIRRGSAEAVFVASDCAISLQREICAMCSAAGVAVDREISLEMLGRLCSLDVGCSVAVVTKADKSE